MYDSNDELPLGHVSVSEARQDLAELVNRAAYRGERVRVTRRGKAIAAIVPMGDVDFLERYEDAMDLRLAKEALADPENAVTYSLEEIEREIGL